MTAASPFPQTGSPLQPLATAIYLPARHTHIPASYARNPHMNPTEITVTQGGVPLLGANGKPFTVAHVAEERRWAIGMDGEVMDQLVFHDAVTQVRIEYYEVLRANGHPNASYEGNPAFEPVPWVVKYVSFGVDPLDETKLQMIGYDPHATDGAKPETFTDSRGEAIAESRLDTLCNAYADRKLRKALTPSELAEVEAHLGLESSAGAAEIATKLELLTAMREAGEISNEVYANKVAALSGVSTPKEPQVPIIEKPVSDKRALIPAFCGKECRGLAGKKVHERNCKRCKALREGEGESG